MAQTTSTVPIAFDDQGQGDPALLCLPGWCVDRTAFAPMADECRRFRRTLSLDCRGHGSSGAPPSDFGEGDLIEDALAVVQQAGVSRVVPVALAHSGWVAIGLRRRLGERVAAESVSHEIEAFLARR